MKALVAAGYTLVFLLVAGLALYAYNKGYDDAADYWSTYKREARVYRELYERAELDAKVINCTALDDNYFLCEKKHHARD